MAKQNEFVDYLLELLAPLGGISARAMFGGHGIYQNGLIFGIVVDDVFYLKADDVNRREFERRGLKPCMFESKSRGVSVAMSYHQCPADALDDPAQMREWANRGVAAALRAAAKKSGGKKARNKSG